MIHLENISKIYPSDPPRAAIEGMSLHIPKHSFVAITGRSGSGKSTLLNIIGALTRPTSGKVVVDDIDITSSDEKKRAAFRNSRIGFVFQSFHILADRTALENVVLPVKFADSVVSDPAQRAERCLEKVGLADRARMTCSTFSGGQLQRVAIARALMMDPPIILADEPTGNLDIETGNEILDLFATLHSETGVTVLVVTHEEEVAKIADMALKMEAGKSVRGETP